jgi:3-dehydroquinate synthase
MVPKLQNSILVEIQSGESEKNLETCNLIWKSLLENKMDRKALLINLGGGVITDMGAFSASTFKRGIPFLQIPTTLLSMVDASVGGKTGIDFMGVKNILGTFTSPLGVWIHTPFLNSLSREEIQSGFSEIVKHGLIADVELFENIESEFPEVMEMDDSLEAFVIRSIEIKNRIVLGDPYERGRRKLLNFGHTLGHALESHSFTTRHPLNHGQAIAMGMVMESFLSYKSAYISIQELNRINRVLKYLFPPRPISEKDYDRLYEIIQNDKKNVSGAINFTFLEGIGKGIIDQTANNQEILEAFKYFNSILDIS